MMNDNIGNNRCGKDRRVKPTPFLSRFTLTGGRRKTVRRQHDRRKHIFVDLYDTRLFLAIFALLYRLDRYSLAKQLVARR